MAPHFTTLTIPNSSLSVFLILSSGDKSGRGDASDSIAEKHKLISCAFSIRKMSHQSTSHLPVGIASESVKASICPKRKLIAALILLLLFRRLIDYKRSASLVDLSHSDEGLRQRG